MRISKQKRNQLILVALAILLVLAGLWYTLIRYQKGSLEELAGQKQAAMTKLSQIQDTFEHSRELEKAHLDVANQLALQEANMVSGDLYSGMVNFIRGFKLPYKIDIPQLTSGGVAVDESLLPKFPYKQVTLAISGTARFHELGRFVADFENKFPASRMINLELMPASSSGPQDRGTLLFTMNIVWLVKPSGARPATTP